MTLARSVPDHPQGIPRRDFVRICSMAAAAVGLTGTAGARLVEAAAAGLKPSVIWLHFQECTGCTESLLRSSHPALADLILDLVSLDYHETLFAAAGHQAEDALKQAMSANAKKYVLVVEGSIPTKDAEYCKIANRPAIELAREVGAQAGAVIAIGSCASFGGLAAADPNPTGAVGVSEVLKGVPVVTLPGCPANPINFLGTVLQYVTLGTLPALDAKNRPLFAYGQTIHENCPRRAHFDAGRFVTSYGDDAHRNGYCLYKMGCKGPATHANCSLRSFGEVDGAWPVGIGHPCYGCTEQPLVWRAALHDTVAIDRPAPPDTYPGVNTPQGHVSAIATGVAGVVAGALVAGGYVASRKVDAKDKEPAAAGK